MSGPKKTKWEIRQEEYQRIKEEQRKKRLNQENEIRNEINSIKKSLNFLISKHQNLAQNIVKAATQWLNEVEHNISYDLRDCWKGINGINNYIKQQETLLFQQQQQINEEILRKQIFEAKVSLIVKSLDEVKTDYKEILNDGIIQRVDLFKKSIISNPDNENTLKQIEQFKQNISKQYDEYKNQLESRKYVANSFAQALNSTINETSDGNYFISGSIDGVPISVNLSSTSYDIDMDTPTDGSCYKGLEALQKHLHSSNIDLGPIKVLKTGKVLNHTIQKNDKVNA